MYDKPQMEIPETVRELAEKNVEQARSAYSQFMDMARQAQQMVQQSQGAVTQTALEIQSKALKFAEQNIDEGFTFASDLARARDLKEYLEIQTRYAQKQMQAYAQQAQDLGRMMAEAAQKAGPKT
jgi:phasin